MKTFWLFSSNSIYLYGGAKKAGAYCALLSSQSSFWNKASHLNICLCEFREKNNRLPAVDRLYHTIPKATVTSKIMLLMTHPKEAALWLQQKKQIIFDVIPDMMFQEVLVTSDRYIVY